MANLSKNASGELHLTLRGETENRVLVALRRWSHWMNVKIERDPNDKTRCLAVTLVTDGIHEATVRDILRRGFGVTFPEDGGEADVPPPPPTPVRASRRG